LPDYPGTVQFAHPFLPRHYRAWREAFYAREKANGDENNAIVVTGNNELSAYLSNMWGDVLAVCELSLENLPPDALTDATGESTPVTVGAWLIPIFQEQYFKTHLTMGG
jgi:hypothetical protein